MNGRHRRRRESGCTTTVRRVGGKKKEGGRRRVKEHRGDVKSLEGEQAQQGRLRVPDRPYLTGSRMSWPGFVSSWVAGSSWVVPGSRLDQGWVRRCHCLGHAWSCIHWHRLAPGPLQEESLRGVQTHEREASHWPRSANATHRPRGYVQVFALAFASSKLAFFRHGTGRTASLWTFAIGGGEGFEVLSRHACAPKDLVAHTPAHTASCAISCGVPLFHRLPFVQHTTVVSVQKGTDNAARHNGPPGVRGCF